MLLINAATFQIERFDDEVKLHHPVAYLVRVSFSFRELAKLSTLARFGGLQTKSQVQYGLGLKNILRKCKQALIDRLDYACIDVLYRQAAFHRF